MRHTVLISRRHSLAGWVALLVCSVGPGYAQGEWTLAGRVVDEKGNPVAGAEVCHDAYSPGRVVARTGSDGRFRLDELQTETVKIVVTAQGKSPSLTKLKAGEITGEADFPLQPGHVLKLRVIDSTGNPIDGVRVFGDDWRDSALLVRFSTDKEEWYEVKEIVSGMALATGIVTQCFPMRNRRLAPCRSLRQGLISHHSGQGGQGRMVVRAGRSGRVHVPEAGFLSARQRGSLGGWQRTRD